MGLRGAKPALRTSPISNRRKIRTEEKHRLKKSDLHWRGGAEDILPLRNQFGLWAPCPSASPDSQVTG